ncbi:hypothetical protein J6590_045043 [Homalodisca vitripennis]|nr:hypothetical protein J6590_045043 [Homalodisca vitripennis]
MARGKWVWCEIPVQFQVKGHVGTEGQTKARSTFTGEFRQKTMKATNSGLLSRYLGSYNDTAGNVMSAQPFVSLNTPYFGKVAN